MASRTIGVNMTDVTAGLQYTHNLGNFENVRVHFEITDSVREDEKVYDASQRVYGWVETLVEEKIKEIQADAASRK
jgi:hypothetical protein